MKKYLVVIKNTWGEIVIYRLNFVMWRLRTILQLLTLYFFWLAIMPQKGMFLGYTQKLMLTYILGTSLIQSLVLSSRSFAVGDEINSGNLSNLLLRPINYFLYWFAKDIADKAANIGLSIVELTILFFLLQPPLFIQTNFFYIAFCLIATILAVILYFFFNFLLGLIGFWSPEVWAPRFIFFILLGFFAGGLFPLDILPKPIFTIFQMSPFPYLLYFPLKIYLGQLKIVEIYTGLGVSLLWVILMYGALKFVWTKGLRTYTAYGK